MKQCVSKTKTGTRCSRFVKDKGTVCFQHKQQARSPEKKLTLKSPSRKSRSAGKLIFFNMFSSMKTISDMDIALESLSEYLKMNLSEGDVSAFAFLYANHDMHRILNFTYRVMPMTRREKDDDTFVNPSRIALVNVLSDLMPKRNPVVESHHNGYAATEENLLKEYDGPEPQLYLILALYQESDATRSRSIELMKKNSAKLDNVFDQGDYGDTTLLLYGCEWGMTDFVRLLIEHGANPLHPNNILAARAVIIGHSLDQAPDVELLELLSAYGVNPPALDEEMREKIQNITDEYVAVKIYEYLGVRRRVKKTN